MKRSNVEFLWGWFDALRRRDTESMAAALDPAIVWQGVRPDLVCHGPEEVAAAFVTAHDANQEIDSLELLGGDDHLVLGVHAMDLAIDEVETAGEIYNVFTIDGQKITRIEDYLEREAALAAAGAQPPGPRISLSDSEKSRVRIASSADAEAIGELLHDFNSEFDEPTPGPRALATRIRQLLDRDTTVLLAEPDRTGLPCCASGRRSGPTRPSAISPSSTLCPPFAVRASDGR